MGSRTLPSSIVTADTLRAAVARAGNTDRELPGLPPCTAPKR